MASPSRTQEREEERRFNMRTLVIASFASATAAVVTSQLWIAGTWIAAAMTPVLVTLVSELVHRPTERIARRMTTERPALVEDPTAEEPTPVEPAPVSATEPAPVRVYRSSTVPSPRRRKIAYGWVAGTAALALAIAVVALTVPELIAGNSLGNSGRTTFFSKPKKSNDSNEATTPATESEDQETDTSPEETTEEPAATETETETETVPTTQEPAPTTTETTPAPSTTQP